MSEELLITQQEVYRLKDRLGMLSALHKGCSGIQAENARLRAQAEALAAALEDELYLLQHLDLNAGCWICGTSLGQPHDEDATCGRIDAVLRAFREASHDAEVS